MTSHTAPGSTASGSTVRTRPHTTLAGHRVTPDTTLRRHAHGRVVLGGSPTRLLRLTEHGSALLDRWCAGEPIGTSPHETVLARRLLDAGLLQPAPGPGRYTPADVTVVVPVKDDPDGLARLLAATADIAHQIVVDDGSATPLLHATTRHLSARGPAAARNTGWRRATTDLVAFLDADTAPEPGWLTSVLPLFDDPRVAAVAPRVVSGYGSSNSDRHSRPLASYERDHSSLDMGPHPAAVRPMSRVSYVPAAALVVRRTALASLGGFDDALRYGEDVDLIWRLLAAGHTVRYQPEATVWHQPRATLRAWLRQRHYYGTAAGPLAIRHPGHLACVRASPWTLAAAALAAAGRPRTAVALAAVEAGLGARTALRRDVPGSVAVALGARRQAVAVRMLADAVRRTWWPLLLPARRGRRLLAASLLPCAVAGVRASLGTHPTGPPCLAVGNRQRTRPLDPVRWTALRIADDVAYSTGVIAGCVRYRTLAPLLPKLAERRQPVQRRPARPGNTAANLPARESSQARR